MIGDVVLNEKAEGYGTIPNLPARPPVMCAGCSHRAAFYGLKQIPDLVVAGDIGCYTLGATPPLNLMDSCLDMGAAVSMAHGMNIADPSMKVLGVIGDSTFVHSGITGLIDIVYNNSFATILILDNYTTGMTGGQDHPGTGLTIKGKTTKKVDFVQLCKSIGVERIFTVDPHDYEEFVKLVKTEVEVKEPSVIIAQRPCALLKYVVHGSPYHVEQDECSKCGVCMEIGCPAINETKDGDYVINKTLCVGCGYCTKLCGFNAIKQGGDQ
jgi:indolepyruvate ferredoxin oxidoreductase alpha subunit